MPFQIILFYDEVYIANFSIDPSPIFEHILSIIKISVMIFFSFKVK